ncbi:hypothetical protein Hamer_G018420 [Homarus americanus]|uniref:Uncharacterized protein n=1 Tax=Homarus americanus TaxID=6706 RepID=A0A8J5MXC4_HOMAM|nr:hypothetical protein Hamer_G018420 [Homarus americanus]
MDQTQPGSKVTTTVQLTLHLDDYCNILREEQRYCVAEVNVRLVENSTKQVCMTDCGPTTRCCLEEILRHRHRSWMIVTGMVTGLGWVIEASSQVLDE